MLAYDPHIRVEATRGRFMDRAEGLQEMIRRETRVQSVCGTVSGRVVLRTHERFHVVQLNGIEASEFDRVSDLRSSVIVGSFLDTSDAASPSSSPAHVVIGAELAMNARLNVGDTATVLSPDFVADAVAAFMMPQGSAVIVDGIFYTGSKEYNSSYAYAPTPFVRSLFRADEGALTSIDIRLKDKADAESVAGDMRSSLPATAAARTWYDLHKDVYGVMRYERYASFIILFIIVFISVFNIFAMLSMTVVKKQRDMGVLAAMG
ncbi:MAG: ABC transporter permease, partial [Candidatus Kapaibacterium sp.]